MSNLSVYANTNVTKSGYLDFFIPRPVPVANTDILWEITSAYAYRPDLLAFDLYGSKELWWVFAQRNIDILKDPVFDFIPGTKIYLPQETNLRKTLGF